MPARTASSSAEAICDHLVAALIKLVDYAAEDEERLFRLQRMTDEQIESVRESRWPGRTRWAASAYNATSPMRRRAGSGSPCFTFGFPQLRTTGWS